MLFQNALFLLGVASADAGRDPLRDGRMSKCIYIETCDEIGCYQVLFNVSPIQQWQMVLPTSRPLQTRDYCRYPRSSSTGNSGDSTAPRNCQVLFEKQDERYAHWVGLLLLFSIVFSLPKPVARQKRVTTDCHHHIYIKRLRNKRCHEAGHDTTVHCMAAARSPLRQPLYCAGRGTKNPCAVRLLNHVHGRGLLRHDNLE